MFISLRFDVSQSGRAVEFSIPQIFRKLGPRRIMQHHHNANSTKALFDTKQFRAIAILPIQVVFRKKLKHFWLQQYRVKCVKQLKNCFPFHKCVKNLI